MSSSGKGSGKNQRAATQPGTSGKARRATVRGSRGWARGRGKPDEKIAQTALDRDEILTAHALQLIEGRHFLRRCLATLAGGIACGFILALAFGALANE